MGGREENHSLASPHTHFLSSTLVVGCLISISAAPNFCRVEKGRKKNRREVTGPSHACSQSQIQPGPASIMQVLHCTVYVWSPLSSWWEHSVVMWSVDNFCFKAKQNDWCAHWNTSALKPNFYFNISPLHSQEGPHCRTYLSPPTQVSRVPSQRCHIHPWTSPAGSNNIGWYIWQLACAATSKWFYNLSTNIIHLNSPIVVVY